MGSVSVGLRHMAWSPDQELVAFCTGQDTLLLMTHQLDPSLDGGQEFVPVTEIAMSPEGFGEGEPSPVTQLVEPAVRVYKLSNLSSVYLISPHPLLYPFISSSSILPPPSISFPSLSLL